MSKAAFVVGYLVLLVGGVALGCQVVSWMLWHILRHLKLWDGLWAAAIELKRRNRDR